MEKAYAEVDKILSFMDKKYVDKVPVQMREYFKLAKLQGYDPDINPNIPLSEQHLEKQTFAILAMLNLNHWCEDAIKRQELINKYKENDVKKEQEARKKYNPDDLFKERKKTRENVALANIEDDSFFKRILKKILNFFKKGENSGK